MRRVIQALNLRRCVVGSQHIRKLSPSLCSSGKLQPITCYRDYSTSNDDSKLFTPGPLNTSHTVKSAMLRDLGSRDSEFLQVVRFIREELLNIAGACKENYSTIPLQGSGTFSVEATLQTSVPRGDNAKVLVLSGGAYGERIAKMCSYLSIPHDVLRNPENKTIDMSEIRQLLETTQYSNVTVIHCETSSGVINPVTELGQLVKQCQPECCYIIDAMSSFGAVPLDLADSHADFIVSSANKCIQGVPGFGFVIAKLSSLLKCKDNSRSLSLDLYDQYEGFEKTSMFRFTPPTHVMLAFRQALTELSKEGGVQARAARYKANRDILRSGMSDLGFTELVAPEYSSYIITSFRYPQSDNFNFTVFYNKLKERGQVLYPGKMVDEDCFRIGNIGDLHPPDMKRLIQHITEVCGEMDI